MKLFMIDGNPVPGEADHLYVSRALVCDVDIESAVGRLMSVLRGRKMYVGRSFGGRVSRPDVANGHVLFDEDGYVFTHIGDVKTHFQVVVSLEVQQHVVDED